MASSILSNQIRRVAIVGAAGRLGSHMTEQLLSRGTATVTALTRPGSNAKFPEGVKVARVDYGDEASIALALQGQQFLIITLKLGIEPEIQHRIVRAAGKAGVSHIMPNIYTVDLVLNNEGLARDYFHAAPFEEILAEIERVGVSAWTVLVGGVWFDHSLPGGPNLFGFDINKRTVTLIDGGASPLNTTTLSQYGRAVAALVGLKLQPDDANDTSTTLSRFENKLCYISSFLLSQRDMLKAVQQVTGTTDADWKIGHQSSEDRIADGRATAAAGDFAGFVKTYFTFLLSMDGQKVNHEHKLDNDLIGLPKENLHDTVKICVKMAKEGYNPFE
ncbi:Fc.00g072460.m01.CDS01 [Cosmosporella sp. VM-42]